MTMTIVFARKMCYGKENPGIYRSKLFERTARRRSGRKETEADSDKRKAEGE